jgi:four helix bundle protein
MKNPKNQTPKPREAPGSNGQKKPVEHIDNWDGAAGSALILNEEAAGGHAKHPFDLEERTAQFGEAVVRFTKKIPYGPSNNRLIDQLVGAGTSVGANYCEADERVSKKDFKNTIGRCTKEAKETMHFLRMVAAAEPELATEARVLYREAKELMLIFASIYRK